MPSLVTDIHDPALLMADHHDRPAAARALSRGAQRGNLVRLASGVYTETDRWLTTPAWDRYRMAIAAHAASRRGQAVFCHLTGADLFGMSLLEVPTDLHVRASTPSKSGTVEPTSPYVNPEAVRAAADRLSTDPRHRRLRHTLPALPPVRRYANLLGCGTGRDQSVRIPVSLSDGTYLLDVRTDPLPTVLASVLSQESLRQAVPPADDLARRMGRSFEQLAAQAREIQQRKNATRRFDRAVDFADGRSESVGESLSRVIIHELGFVLPELQVEFRSPSGEFLGRPDFWWKQVQLIGEFDGMTKYTGAVERNGRTAEEVLVAERRRELKLAGADRRVIRWMWKDLMNERAFEAQLVEAGVPRAR